MTACGRTIRSVVVGLVLTAATVGLSACGSSDKINPGTPGTQSPTNAPTSPETSKAPSGGGAAF